MTTIIQPSCSDNEEPGALHVDDALAHMLSAVSPVKGYEQVALLEAVSSSARARGLAH